MVPMGKYNVFEFYVIVFKSWNYKKNNLGFVKNLSFRVDLKNQNWVLSY